MESRETTVFFAETQEGGLKTLLEVIRSLGGQHFKTIGTTYICLFDNAQAAVNAGLKLLRMEKPISFRIGMAKGPVTLTRDDAFGEVVNLAARLQGNAKQQEVYVADSVLENVDRARVPYKELGTRQFKGIDRVVHVFALLKEHPKVAPTAAPDVVQKPPKELFDFSRVDQERIAEEESIRVSMPEVPLSGDKAIPLAAEPKDAPAFSPRSRASTSRTNPEALIAARAKENRKRVLLVLLVFAIVIPALAIGGLWGYSAWKKRPVPPPPPSAATLKARESEVLTSIDQAKVRKNIPRFGTLMISTEPTGAQVYFNERLVSERTPVHINNVPIRTPLQVRVSKYGFEDSVQLFNLQPGEEREVTAKLKKKGK